MTTDSAFVVKGTTQIEITITKRSGKSFEGRYSYENGGLVSEITGTVEDSGAVEFKFTKIVKVTDEVKRKAASGLKNFIGLKVSGAVDEKKYKAKYVHPIADNPRLAPRVNKLELSLKE